MDTNKKQSNMELFVKIICIILTIVTFGSSAYIGFSALRTMNFYGEDSLYLSSNENIDLQNTNAFVNQFRSDINSVQDICNTNSSFISSYKKYLDSEKEKIVNEAYKKYISETPSNSDEDCFDFHYEKSLKYGNTEDTFTFDEMVGESAEYSSDESVKDAISDGYFKFVDGVVSSLEEAREGANTQMREIVNFKYIVIDKSGKTILSNLNKEESKNDILNSSFYCVISNGKTKCKNLDAFEKTGMYYNFPKGSTAYFTANTKFTEPDIYSVMNEYLEKTKDKSVKNEIISAAVLLVLSLALAVFVLVSVSKNSKGEFGKLSFVDYVPLDIHLIISGAIVGFGIAGLYSLYDLFMDGSSSIQYFDNFGSLAVCGLFAGIWAVLLEYLCSFIRTVNIKKKQIWKSILVVFIAVKLFKLIVKVCKKVYRGIKNSLAYKPQTFKKNIVVISLLLLICEFVLILMFVGAVASGIVILAVIVALLFVAFNCFVYIKLIKYFVELDKIIVSAKEKEELKTDIEKLPQSLKALAESLKYSNEELSSAVARAVKDERLKTELITNVSHDLKTPLTSIITYVDLLSKCDINDDKAKEYIKVLDEKGAKLKRLIEDLIEASKLSSGNVSVNITKLNLTELTAQAVGENQSEFEKAKLDLIMQDGADAVIVDADGSKTFRVIENLLTNARKYSALSSRVYISVYKESGYGVFEIKNISAEPLNVSPEELTERFVRGDSSRTKDGNGLGLSIAKELCKAQNAELELIIDGDLFKAKIKFKI